MAVSDPGPSLWVALPPHHAAVTAAENAPSRLVTCSPAPETYVRYVRVSPSQSTDTSGCGSPSDELRAGVKLAASRSTARTCS